MTFAQPDVTLTQPDVTLTQPDVTLTQPDVTLTQRFPPFAKRPLHPRALSPNLVPATIPRDPLLSGRPSNTTAL